MIVEYCRYPDGTVHALHSLEYIEPDERVLIDDGDRIVIDCRASALKSIDFSKPHNLRICNPSTGKQTEQVSRVLKISVYDQPFEGDFYYQIFADTWA